MILKREGTKERMELLEIGEKLGYPRLGYGRSTKIPHDRRIPQGKDGWEKFCAHGHVTRILPALRIGRVLRDNNVEVYHPLSGKEVMPDESRDRDVLGHMTAGAPAAPSPAPDLLADFGETPAETRPTWVAPGTVAVYAPGKRRKYPVKKNKKRVNNG